MKKSPNTEPTELKTIAKSEKMTNALPTKYQEDEKLAVPKCKKASSTSKSKNQGLSFGPVLNRTTFRTSREMDFFSEKELVTQTGHEIGEWPLVVIKELVDNSLDACEERDVVPNIAVTADKTGITVRDNGPGLPEATLKSALDFTVRASNREGYISPCRGAQGHALKTILPMPRIIDAENGKLIVQANGKKHIIRCGADPISQRAIINDDVSDVAKCKNSHSLTNNEASLQSGTEIRIEWSPVAVGGDVQWPFDGLLPIHDSGFAERIRALVEGFALFNPHATFTLNWFESETTWKCTNPRWEKWKPSKPTSPHWYELAHLARLVGAYITHDREARSDRLVSDVIAEFDGLTGSQKRSKVLDETHLKRVKLSELVVGDRLDSERIAKLLVAMRKHTRPVNPRRLGIIGEEHLKARLLAMGVQEESFRYSRKVAKDSVPWVLESAFGWLGEEANDSRRIYAGANWSAAIKIPFRSFGDTGEGLETALADMRATRIEPVVFVLHLAHPRLEYVDRGKSALIIRGAK